jgi:acyl-CoA thioester hydrolase
MGVAYYANYLRWFEMGRNEYLRDVGYPYARLESEGVVLPVTEVGCLYTEPARYDDLIEVQAWIVALTRVRVRFEYRIARPHDGAELARGFTVHACLRRDGGITRLPGSLLRALGCA